MDTSVTALLDAAGIAYRRLPHAQPALTCEAAAKERGVPLEEMVKCMVLMPKRGRPALVCLPADRRLSMKKAREVLGAKSFSTSTPEMVKAATGYELGSIPPLALPDDLALVADQHLLKKKNVNISSGDARCGLELSTWDFRKLFKGRFADVSE